MNLLTKVRQRIRPGIADDAGRERQAKWYNEYYSGEAREVYATHYTKSPYYFLWSVIVDRLSPTAKILNTSPVSRARLDRRLLPISFRA